MQNPRQSTLPWIDQHCVIIGCFGVAEHWWGAFCYCKVHYVELQNDA